MSDTTISSILTVPEARKTSSSSSYIIVGDNIDKTVSLRHMTIGKQRQSITFMLML